MGTERTSTPKRKVRYWTALIADALAKTEYRTRRGEASSTESGANENRSDRPREVVPDGVSPLWRAHNGLRALALLYATVWFVILIDQYRRPVLGTAILLAMVAWTIFTIRAYRVRSGRTNRLVAIDQVVVSALFISSAFVLTGDQMIDGKPTVVTIWHGSMVTVAAVRWGILGGTVSGAVAATTNWVMRGYIDANMWMDTILHLAIGILLGLAADTARRSTERLARALRTEAATAERERLARDIHDSVLQVLARVRKRGGELGGEAAELARLAGEQETALRALVSTSPAEVDDGETDLGARLRVLNSAKVQVSVPATKVTLPAPTASALFSVINEALQNVEKHAGPDAKAWVLLEDLGEEIVLSIRDNGPGIPDGRLAEAAAAGRMGVAQSIRGRVERLGGTVSLDTAPTEGTEWELHVPRSAGSARPERAHDADHASGQHGGARR